jgi:class 3 adenylate cyclase/tetratricopeptide (TPR) repeat protein
MAQELAQRRLAAIMAADVVGYSRLLEQDEASTLAAIKARRREVLEPLLARHCGRIVKTMGDGVLVEFASAVNAVACATLLQQRMTEANADLPDNRRIVLRIGINLGDIVVDGGDLHGEGIVVAVRLQALSEPGSVYLSGAVADQVQGKIPLNFRNLGDHTLKNITKPVRVYRIAADSEQERATLQHSQLPAKPSIAVLPFANLTGDAGEDYISEGFTGEIVMGLGRFHDLFVTAQGSTWPYKGRNANICQVGRDLGVRYVVKGSIRSIGDNLRVLAELADTSTGNQLWAEHYDQDRQHTFAVQDAIIRTIVATIMGRVREQDRKRALHKTKDELAAYDLLLRGRHCLEQWSKEEIIEARQLFERAIALDPDDSAAYADLATTYSVEHQSDWSEAPEAAAERAFELARKAVALDDTDAKARRTMAVAYMLARSDMQMANLQVEAAISFNPNEYWNFCVKGWLVTMAGHADEGISCATEAMRLNPFSHDDCLETQFVAAYCTHRYEEALAAIARMRAPRRHITGAGLAACYAQMGRDAEARRAMADFLAEAAKTLAHYPGDDCNAWRAYWARKLPFQRPTDFEHLLEGYRKAGLPV